MCLSFGLIIGGILSFVLSSFGQQFDDYASTVPLTKFTEYWQSAYESGDFETLREMYEADARLMTRDRPAKSGVDEILSYFKTTREAGAQAVITFENEDFTIENGFGFVTAKWWLEVPQNDGSIIRDFGRSLVVFKRGPDKKWRIWRDIDNHTPDVTFDNKPEEKNDL